MKCGSCQSVYPDPDIVGGIAYFVCAGCGNIFEIKDYAPIQTQELKDQIVAAFGDVELGQGIGLYQAQAIDDYETEELQQRYRESDEKKDWINIPHEELQRCNSSLSFFDAEGMRFHLPAFIITSIEDKVDNCIFYLTQNSEFVKSKFVVFNELQRQCIRSYLSWCLLQEEYEFYRDDIKSALTSIWS